MALFLESNSMNLEIKNSNALRNKTQIVAQYSKEKFIPLSLNYKNNETHFAA